MNNNHCVKQELETITQRTDVCIAAICKICQLTHKSLSCLLESFCEERTD